MKKILLFNPGISSLNRGDEIISDAVISNLDFMLRGNVVTNISTHTPLNFTYIRRVMNYNYKFVCGSNLLMGKMNGIFKQWDIGLLSGIAAKDSILVGVGWWQPNDKPNLYTKFLYNRILNKNYLHSVRDEYTKQMLASIGITNVINTGCATMWGFTPEFCKEIPDTKSEEVVFTLTDYNPNLEADNYLLSLLLKNYKRVYFWPQGDNDYEYIKSLNYDERIEILDNSLACYDEFLSKHQCDYIGTRLHGGIRALQNKKRTMILAVDNRAREKRKDFNIPCIERDDIESLEDIFINKKYKTNINIPLKNINKWKEQFKRI